SEVYGHFGSASAFVVVDDANDRVTTIVNSEEGREHGACDPLRKLNNQKIDIMVVGGIGAGALNILRQAGIKVFAAKARTMRENVQMLRDLNLAEFTPQQTCAGHGHGKGCGH
ncbi:MAG: NifB/NifX family molybdenum-iron cluster-binding protein, partial [Nitrospirota bacterium]